ncbi:MAG: prepilin peptidase [Burkholderiaceae bacterium]
MDASFAPSPGIAWGRYPQRGDASRPNAAARWQRWLGSLDSFARSILSPLEQGSLRRFAETVEAATLALRLSDDDALQREARRLSTKMRVDGLIDEHIVAALALSCELAARRLGKRPFAAQLIAVRILLSNRLAEMQTGEGKTLAAGLGAAVAAMAGIPVHVLTANDYLVARDCEAMSPLFEAMGLSAAAVTQPMPPEQRREAYRADIVYVTAKEVAFDYLRDRIALGRRRREIDLRLAGNGSDSDRPAPMLRGLCMALIDEADSVLLDEAGTPLILSRMVRDPANEVLMQHAFAMASRLWENRDFRVDRVRRRVELLAAGDARIEAMADAEDDRVWGSRRLRNELISQALAARHLYGRDRDYLVREDKIVMIDEPTGRIAEGRTWSRGLHQMIEIKEGVAITGRTETMARITFQRFFPRYLRLCGMSGTLREARSELRAVYGLPVAKVPLRRPCLRIDQGLHTYVDAARKWRAVVDAVAAAQRSGQPVLVGTESVRDSAVLSSLLGARGVRHRMLNAAQDRDEADIVARAGEPGAVTVATNMAGRGTDILVPAESQARGGLLVLACHRNRERRIDRQLSGRAARQGQRGATRTIAAITDPMVAERLPSLARTLAIRAASPDGRVPRTVGALCFFLAQRGEEIRRKRERVRLIDADERRARLLAIAGEGE